MEKLIKTICGLFFILCLSSKSYADPKSLSGYPWDLQQMPIWCGPLEMVNEALKQEASLGRAGAEATGDPVMMVTEFKMEDQKIYTIDIPSGEQTCILVHTFNRTSLTKENND